VLASNEVGVFSLELSSSAIPSPLPSANGSSAAIMSREELRMEDLLQAQFENELNLLAFEGMATFSINMLIHQINKSESHLLSYRSILMSQNFTLLRRKAGTTGGGKDEICGGNEDREGGAGARRSSTIWQ